MTYTESLEYLNDLAKFGIKPGLDRIISLLNRLDNPQNKYKTIHVTGTNGKGSVTNMLASILSVSGCYTGAYTSPHLFRYNERMAINDAEISDEDFAAIATIVRGYVEAMLDDNEECPTQFEFLTAMAFFYFARKSVDYAVIEVGLGGLLDSTNVVQPEIAVITNVTLEHADKCGGTLEGVAYHKAGIIKNGIPVVSGAEGIAVNIIEKRANELKSPLYLNGKDFSVKKISDDRDGMGLVYEESGNMELSYGLKMLADYQVDNSAIAVKSARLISQKDDRITTDTIIKGMAVAFWPGRFEVLSLKGHKIVIDGAHNPAGVEALRRSLDLRFPNEKRLYLLGILRDKAVASMIGLLLRPGDRVVVTSPDSDRAAAPEEIAGRIHDAEVIAVSGERARALDIAIERQNHDELLVVTGSLYLIGYIRKILTKKLGGNG